MTGSAPQWRTILELGVIGIAIYLIVGSPVSDLQSLFGSSNVQVSKSRAKVESIVHQLTNLDCPQHSYQTHIYSSNPLVILIEDFLTTAEAEHLIAISQDKWQQSTVFNAGVEVTDETVRKSEKALVDRDEIVQCIEKRALDFQGWPKDTYIERLWTQRYNVSGHYSLHYDWASATKSARRISTFMVYVDTDCEGGGTQFPRLPSRQAGPWCDLVECSDQAKGVTFKAKERAAVFWENFDSNGRGYKDTIHAGMPVVKGTKIGLNIWSWYQAG